MLKFAKLFLAVALLSAGAFAQSGRVQVTPPPTPDDTVRIHTEEIKLNVLAFDDKGEFFRDVTKNDLVITENDILHQPESVRWLPASILIVLDTSGNVSGLKSLDQTRRVAEGIVNALRPGDSVAILAYSDKPVMIGEWTSDKAQTLAALKRAKFGRRSNFVDALKFGTDFLLRTRLDNRHMVLITDGVDSGGRSSAKFDAYQRLLGTDISVHVLSYATMESAEIEPRTKTLTNDPPPKAMPDEIAATLPNGARDPHTAAKVGPTVNLDRAMIRNLKARQLELETSEQQLEQLSENTNGEFVAPGTVDEMIEKGNLIARMIDSTYSVTYTPKVPVVATRGVAERNIQVTSKRPGLVVQARRRLLVNSK